jgi:hypothetical protein
MRIPALAPLILWLTVPALAASAPAPHARPEVELAPARIGSNSFVPLATAAPSLGAPVRLSNPDAFGDPVTEKATSHLATNGEGYFAVWVDEGVGLTRSLVQGARIAGDGTVLDAPPLTFGNGSHPSVVWNGRAYLVIWTGAENTAHVASIEGERITTIAIDDAIGPTQVASNGNTTLVVTSTGAFLLDREMQVVREHRIASQLADGEIAVASAGDEYLIAGGVVTQRVHADGSLGEPRLTGSERLLGVVAASDGTDWLTAWRSSGNVAGKVVFRDEAPAPQRNIAIAEVAHPDRSLHSLALAWRGNEYLLAYVRGGFLSATELYLQRVDATGAPIGTATPMQVTVDYPDDPDLAIRADGSGALLWIDARDGVRMALFESASTQFTKVFSPAAAAKEQLAPAMQRVGGAAVVAWIERDLDRTEVRVGRVGATPLVVDADTSAKWVDLDYDGNLLWVTWYADGVLRFRRYTAQLAAIDERTREYFAPSNAVEPQAAAAGDGALLVVWRSNYAGRPPDLVGKIVRADGSDADVAISGTTFGEDHAAVALWDGSRFFVAWRYYDPAFGDPPIPVQGFIRARHFTASGDPVEAQPVTLWDQADDWTSGLVASSSPQGIVLAWDQLDDRDRANELKFARYTGTAPLQPTTLTLTSGPTRTLAAIAALDTGEVDVYWWHRIGARTAVLNYERLGASLQSTGSRGATEPFQLAGIEMDLAATVIGTLPVVVHTKIDEEAGEVTRLFVRTTSVKKRAVR